MIVSRCDPRDVSIWAVAGGFMLPGVRWGAETVHAMATHCLISHIYIVFYLKKFFYYRQQRRAVQGCIRQLSGRVCD